MTERTRMFAANGQALVALLTFVLCSTTGINCVRRVSYNVEHAPRVAGRNRHARPHSAPVQDALRALSVVQQACVERTRQTQRDLSKLDRVRAILSPECTFRESSADGLRLRLSCQSPMLFDRGENQLKRDFDARIPRAASCQFVAQDPSHFSRIACVGEILASGGEYAEIRVGVVAAVDRLPLLQPQSGCDDVSEHFRTPVTALQWRVGDAEMWAANDRLAYCRAARVASAIERGIEGIHYAYLGPEVDPPLRPKVAISALGASDVFYDALHCPARGNGECEQARRVEVLLQIVPRERERHWVCDEQGDDPAAALYCLQSCERAANASIRPQRAAETELPSAQTPNATMTALLQGCWHFASTPATDPDAALSAGTLASWLGLLRNSGVRCGTAEEFHRRQRHSRIQ